MNQLGTSPYPGIRPFREDEEYLFFGREAQVDALVDTLARHRFLAIIGSSGCGKSSLVNCGLRPALHRGLLSSAGSRWRMATCRPGADPIRALAQALARPGALHQTMDTGFFTQEELIESTLTMGRTGLVDAYRQACLPPGTNLLLVVDQFEELFRYRGLHSTAQSEGDPGTAFVNLLLEARRQDVPIYIVLTMRSDFLGDCARFTGLPEAINQGQYLVPRMTREERRAAIQGPARVFGSDLAPTLLTRLVNDVGDDPDQLSLLQHALSRTWDHWQASGEEGPIGSHHYDAVGGLSGALNQHAEELFSTLSPTAQTGCASVFRTLTDKSTDSRGIRRPTRFSDLVAITGLDPALVWSILAPFRAASASFLMPPAGEELHPETVIDLSHESLMRIWTRLRDWGNEEAEAARMLNRLCDASDLHASGQASLWRDPELQFAIDWRDRHQPTSTWAHQYGRDLSPALSFLEASWRAREEAVASEKARAQAEQNAREAQARQRRALRFTIGAICASTLVAGVTGVLWLRAEEASQKAFSRQLAAQSATELNNGQLNESLVLAARAWTTHPTLEAQDSLLAGLNRAPDNWVLAAQQGVLALASSRDGRLIASAGRDGSVMLWKPGSSEPLARLSLHQQPVQALAFSVDGKTLASGDAEGQLILWDTDSMQPRGPSLREHQGAIQALAFSKGGVLASAGADQTILVRDGITGEVNGLPLRGHQDIITRLRFSPDGTRLASVSYDGSLMLWIPGISTPMQQTSFPAILHDVAFAPDGKTMAVARSDREIMLLSTRELRPQGPRLVGHDSAVRTLLFSDDGRHLISGGDDSQVLDWDLHRPDSPPKPLSGHAGAVTALTSSHDNQHVVSAGEDDLLSWHTRHQGPEMRRLPPHDEAAWALAWHPNGQTLAASDSRGNIQLRRVGDGGELQPALQAHTALVTHLQWIHQGQTLLSAGQDGQLLVWTPYTSTQPRVLAQGEPIQSLSYNPATDEVAIVDFEGRLLRWDVSSGKALPPIAVDGPLADLAWSLDGSELATVNRNEHIQVWDTAGQPVASLQMRDSGNIRRIAWSGSKTLLIATQNRGLRRWITGSSETTLLGTLSNTLLDLVVSPDGNRLVSAELGGHVRLWDLNSGQVLREPLLHHPGPSLAVAWSPDGNQLASSGWSRDVLLISTAASTWTELACNLVKRNPPVSDQLCNSLQ